MTDRVVPVNVSPFSNHAWEFIEHGIPCMPVGPGTKVPGTCDFGSWRPMHGWQQYANRMPTEIEIDIWEGWPDAGVCVPLGGISGLLGIDIDTDRPDIIGALEAELAGLTVCRKRGKRGYTAFVRAPAELHLAQAKWDVDGLRVLDLLHGGRQVVMPPSIHPDTRRPYTWDTNMRPWDDELPQCPLDIVDRCQRVIEKFQSPDDKRHEFEQRERAANPFNANDAEGRRINDAAMAQLSRWVPDLIPKEYLSQTFTGYRAKPFWRGGERADELDVGISTTGIKDFCADEGYTPIDLVLAVRGGNLGAAMDWLASRCGVVRTTTADWSDVGEWFKDINFKLPSDIEREKLAALLTHGPVVVDDGTRELRPVAKPSLISTQGMPSELMQPPGILGEVFRWILATSRSPLPEIAMQAALAFGSTMCRQLYIGPTKTRSNMSLIGIAMSGYGKAHPQECIRNLLHELGQDCVLGGSKIASGAAILSALGDSSTGAAQCYIIDEVDSLLSASLGKYAQQHQREIADNLLSLYSAHSQSNFKGADRADRKMHRNDVIPYPHVTVLGCTTPDKFYDTIKGKDIASGFVNRLVIAQASEQRPQDQEPSTQQWPNGVLLWSKTVRNPRYMVNGKMDLGASAENPVTVDYADAAARKVMDSFKSESREIQDRLNTDGGGMGEIVARWYENAQKAALIAGVAKYPEQPKIDLECAQWAVDYVRWAGRAVLDAASSRTYESDFDESVQKVLAYIIKRQERGATKRDLSKGCRAFKALDERQAKGVIDRLTTGGLVEFRQMQAGGGNTRHAWVAVDGGDE